MPHAHSTTGSALTFPSRIICFRLLISFFSSKLAASSFCRGVGEGEAALGVTILQEAPWAPRTSPFPDTHNLTLPPHHVDLCEDL